MVIQDLPEKKYVEKEIKKGGKVKSDQGKEVIHFSLRMRKDLSDMIDDALVETFGFTKTGWICQAIHEKLKKEK